MTLSISTVTLAPGSSRTYSLAPGEAVTVATEPNCYVTVTETPDVISSADLDGQTNVRTSILQYKGEWTYGPYALGGTVVVDVSSAKSTSSVSVTLGSSAAAVVGAAGGVPAMVSLDNPDSASANVAAIQRSLDAGGMISLMRPGTIWINDTLIYDSDTQIVLGPQTRIKMVAGIRKPLLRSRAYYRMRDTPVQVTITWSSGMTFSVSWAGHGKIKGDAIWINGATLQAQFKGVFVIETVTDANTVVVRANRIPAGAPTGDVFAVAATQHVTITGGTWDYNYDGIFATDPLARFGMMHAGVYNVWVKNTRVDNVSKYSYWWCAHKGCGFDQAGTNKTNSDICKIYGPGVHFRGRGIFGECSDDACSMQTREPVAFAAYQPYWGDLIDCTVHDIDSVSATSLAVLYTHAIADGLMDRCGYSNIRGRAPNGFRAFTNTAEKSAGWVWGKGVQADCTYPARLDAFQCQKMEIEICATTSGATPGDQVLVNSAFVAQQFIVRPYLVTDSFTGPDALSINFGGTAQLLHVLWPNSLVANGSHPRVLNLGTTSVVQHAVIDGYEGNADQIVECNATNTPTISVINSRVGGAAVLSARSSCTLNMRGNDITNASNGVVRFNATATVNLRTDGTNRLRAGSWYAAPAGTPTFNVYGWDIGIDPIAVASTTVGQFCNSTQAGTKGGPAVRTPAGWVALGTGASGVNTVIT